MTSFSVAFLPAGYCDHPILASNHTIWIPIQLLSVYKARGALLVVKVERNSREYSGRARTIAALGWLPFGNVCLVVSSSKMKSVFFISSVVALGTRTQVHSAVAGHQQISSGKSDAGIDPRVWILVGWLVFGVIFVFLYIRKNRNTNNSP